MTELKADDAVDLEKRVAILLKGCIGASPLPSRADRVDRSGLRNSPWFQGIFVGIIYGLLFCALPAGVTWLLYRGWPKRHLLLFSIYGSLYFAWATFIARQTSMRLMEIVRSQVIPSLSVEGATRVSRDLDERFSERRINIISVGSALAGILIATAAIAYDVGYYPCQIGWWALGWFVLFLTAARTTYVGRFYSCFAKRLGEEPIYALDPARSVLVKGVTALGQSMLLFWFGIIASIAPLILVASLGDQEITSPQWYEHLALRSAFVWLVVPVTSLFSIPFGTVVYLESEQAIRRAVAIVLRKTLLSIERQIAALLAKNGELTEPELLKMSGLSTIHARLVDTGKYRGALAVGLSLLIPLIGPATAVAKFIVDHQKH